MGLMGGDDGSEVIGPSSARWGACQGRAGPSPLFCALLAQSNTPWPRAVLPPAQALGPEPKASTKFFLAFNVPEQALSSSDEGQAAWEELQASASGPVPQASTARQSVD